MPNKSTSRRFTNPKFIIAVSPAEIPPSLSSGEEIIADDVMALGVEDSPEMWDYFGYPDSYDEIPDWFIIGEVLDC